MKTVNPISTKFWKCRAAAFLAAVLMALPGAVSSRAGVVYAISTLGHNDDNYYFNVDNLSTTDPLTIVGITAATAGGLGTYMVFSHEGTFPGTVNDPALWTNNATVVATSSSS